MKKLLLKTSLIPVLLVIIMLGLTPDVSWASEETPSEWQFNQIERNESGYFISTGTDPYIIFTENDSTENCTLNAVQFTIKFKPMPPRPLLMELFWRSEHQGFSEARKIFFVLHPEKKGDTINFVIPLKHQAGHKQIRLDLPRNLESAFIIENFKLIPINDLPEDALTIEPYYSYTELGACSPHIIIPHLIHTIKHGCSRMTKDPIFLLTWLLFITLTLFAIRLVTRDIKKQKS
jgi:hypothetical protein